MPKVYSLDAPAPYLSANAPSYRDALSMAVYTSGMSVKLRYMAGLLKHIILDTKERVLFFVDWPLCGWDVEMFFRTLGLVVVVINASQTYSAKTSY